MQNKRFAFIINLIILVAGVVIIATARGSETVHSIILITGVAFLATAIVNFFSLTSTRHKEHQPGVIAKTVGWITSVAAVILGGAMVIVPETFRLLFIYVFAISLFVGGIYHIYMMASGLHPVKFPLWAFICPLALIVAGIALFFVGSLREGSANIALIVTGVGMVVFVVTSLLEMIISSHYKRQMKKAGEAPAQQSYQSNRPDNQRMIQDVNPDQVKDISDEK